MVQIFAWPVPCLRVAFPIPLENELEIPPDCPELLVPMGKGTVGEASSVEGTWADGVADLGPV